MLPAGRMSGSTSRSAMCSHLKIWIVNSALWRRSLTTMKSLCCPPIPCCGSTGAGSVRRISWIFFRNPDNGRLKAGGCSHTLRLTAIASGTGSAHDTHRIRTHILSPSFLRIIREPFFHHLAEIFRRPLYAEETAVDHDVHVIGVIWLIFGISHVKRISRLIHVA